MKLNKLSATLLSAALGLSLVGGAALAADKHDDDTSRVVIPGLFDNGDGSGSGDNGTGLPFTNSGDDNNGIPTPNQPGNPGNPSTPGNPGNPSTPGNPGQDKDQKDKKTAGQAGQKTTAPKAGKTLPKTSAVK